jgi:hypothetical protein
VERLAVSEGTMQKFGLKRFSRKKLNEVEGKEQFADLESLDGGVDINKALEATEAMVS